MGAQFKEEAVVSNPECSGKTEEDGAWEKLADRENRLVVAKMGGRRAGKDWEYGSRGCKLVYTGWINNKVLLYSAGYPVINHSVKEYEKEYICMCIIYTYICVYLNHCCRTKINACMLSCFSCVQLCATLWTAAHQAPLSLGSSRQQHWNG